MSKAWHKKMWQRQENFFDQGDNKKISNFLIKFDAPELIDQINRINQSCQVI